MKSFKDLERNYIRPIVNIAFSELNLHREKVRSLIPLSELEIKTGLLEHIIGTQDELHKLSSDIETGLPVLLIGHVNKAKKMLEYYNSFGYESESSIHRDPLFAYAFFIQKAIYIFIVKELEITVQSYVDSGLISRLDNPYDTPKPSDATIIRAHIFYMLANDYSRNKIIRLLKKKGVKTTQKFGEYYSDIMERDISDELLEKVKDYLLDKGNDLGPETMRLLKDYIQKS